MNELKHLYFASQPIAESIDKNIKLSVKLKKTTCSSKATELVKCENRLNNKLYVDVI